jgi:two-component system, NtrC family, sensor histidine kinase HydH
MENRMIRRAPKSLRSGLQTSPWIILGSTAILLIVVLVLTVQNTNREKRNMIQLLSTKGAALIRAVEAGARTGMMGMMWGGQQIQQLLEETSRLPDVLYMAVIDHNGVAVAHSDPSKINVPFSPGRKITHFGPDEYENWELVNLDNQHRVFEVHRHFRPLSPDTDQASRHMQAMMKRHGMASSLRNDWFSEKNRQHLLIIVGLDTTPFEEAIRTDIQTTIVLAIVLLLLGFGGFVSLFWMHNYRVTKRSLQDTSAFADELVNRLPVGLIATDRSGRITFFNAAAEKITGLNKVRAQDQMPDTLLPAGLCGLQERLNQEESITEQEMECAFTAGRTVPVSVSATRIINEMGDFVGYVMIIRDLGEVRRLQKEVQRHEKLAALGELAAGVAHEIRNPLSSIKGLASFFADQSEKGSNAQEAAEVMAQEVDRLNRVITELLDFARPTDLKRESVDLKELVSRSLTLVQQDAINQNIVISLESADDVCPVWIDPDRMAQCLLNLYLNAIQAMENNGTLTVRIYVDDDQYVHISVSDTGSGVHPELLDKIFNPYFTTKKTGTGLGLAIVHKIVDTHQGRINVESTSSQGTSFTIIIPCQPVEI